MSSEAIWTTWETAEPGASTREECANEIFMLAEARTTTSQDLQRQIPVTNEMKRKMAVLEYE
jgi:hypothetical protein